MEIILTKNCKERMLQRGINFETAIEILNNPDLLKNHLVKEKSRLKNWISYGKLFLLRKMKSW